MHDELARARAAARAIVTSRWSHASIGECVLMPGDASSRRYVRCAVADPAATAPSSVIVMLNEGSGMALSSDELGVFGKDGPTELPFLNVQRYLATLTDAVPAVYGWTRDYRELLLEDVGDVSLWAAAEDAQVETLFGAALELLAEIQQRAVDDGSGCYAFRQVFDERLFDWELEHFLQYGVAPEAGDLEACRTELHGISRRLAALPRVFTHRDYHAWNLHVHGGRIRVLDFQDALLGPALYDVASLLTDRTTPSKIPFALEQRLIEGFAQRVPASAFGEMDPRTAFDLCAIQRVLKVIGRFNYLAEVKGKPRYAALLPAIVPTARRLCSRRPELAATAALLEHGVKGGRPCAP